MKVLKKPDFAQCFVYEDNVREKNTKLRKKEINLKNLKYIREKKSNQFFYETSSLYYITLAASRNVLLRARG